MKTFFTSFILSVLFIQGMSAQNNNLIIYSQEGLQFTVILNGIRQNPKPETNVKITGLNAPNYQVKIIFANNSLDIDQNAYLMDGGVTTTNTEYTYGIINVKGKYKLRYRSAAPIAGSNPESNPQQTVVVYSQVNTIGATSTTTNTSTNTTNTVGNTAENGATVGITLNGVGMNVNVSGDTEMSTNTTTTTTTSTTTSSSGTNNNNSTYVLQGYNGIYGCPAPMSGSDFQTAKNSITSKGFDESRLILAKQIIGSNCLLCKQIKDLMQLMSFEETKLELAKFAWHHNLDKGNYYQLNDAFGFESSIEELNQYIQTH
jgi:hypothetical protein